MKLECFRSDLTGQWFWRLRAANGKIVEIGGDGYMKRSGLLKAVNAKLRRTHPDHLPEVVWRG